MPMKPTAWTALGLVLALLGPGTIALLSMQLTRGPISLGADAPWLGAFAGLVALVAAIAILGEGLKPADVGFGRMTMASVPSAIVLALFFILVFGPAASWALAQFGFGSFDAGQRLFAVLPAWYLCLTVVVVAAGEEWLYRGYAIERLQALTGSTWIAGGVSLLLFAVAHLPVWGLAVSLTTLVSGGIMTALYLWRRDVSFLMLAHVITDLYGLVIAPLSRA